MRVSLNSEAKIKCQPFKYDKETADISLNIKSFR